MSNKPTKKPSPSQRVAQAQRGASGGSRTWWIVGAVVLVFLVAALVAIRVTSGSEDAAGGGPSPSGGTVVPSGDLVFGSVSVDGDPLPPLSTGSADPAVGVEAPTIRGETFDGSEVALLPGDGPAVAMVLAHWCPHCQAEVPRIQEWLDDNGMPSDVSLVAVSTAQDRLRGNFPPGSWLRGEGWSVPTMLDDEQGTAEAALGATGYPFFVAIDASGEVVQRASGEIGIPEWESLLAAARS